MDRIEEVKKILFEGYLTDLAAEKINQLYEPQPDQSSRLLTPEEVEAVWSPHVLTPVLEAQRDLTASIKDAECEERIMREGNHLICKAKLAMQEKEFKPV